MRDELALVASGSGDLEELKREVNSSENVFIGFYREGVDDSSLLVIINYIPATVSGVRRGGHFAHKDCGVICG